MSQYDDDDDDDNDDDDDGDDDDDDDDVLPPSSGRLRLLSPFSSLGRCFFFLRLKRSFRSLKLKGFENAFIKSEIKTPRKCPGCQIIKW